MRARLKAMLETEFTLEGKIIQDSLSNTSLNRELNDPRFKILEISVQSVSYHFVGLHGRQEGKTKRKDRVSNISC